MKIKGIKEIKERVDEIKQKVGDPEMAHGLEDKLYKDFIKLVAKEGSEPHRTMAKEVLKTSKLNFWRVTS